MLRKRSLRGLLRGWAQGVVRATRGASGLAQGPIARFVGVALALVVLAGIGRSALAGGGMQANARVETAVAPAPTQNQWPDPWPDPWADAQAPLVPTSTDPPSPPAQSTSEAPRARASPEDPVFLNRATQDDLRRLPGIGPKRAQAILALRVRLGRFRQIEDLLKVKGIGRAALKKLRPLVRIDAPETASDGGAAR